MSAASLVNGRVKKGDGKKHIWWARVRVLFFLKLSFLYIGAIEFVNTRIRPPTKRLKNHFKFFFQKDFITLNKTGFG